MIDYRVQLFWSDEDGRYVADIPELAPCTAVGATPEEALAKVEALKATWLGAGPGGSRRVASAVNHPVAAGPANG